MSDFSFANHFLLAMPRMQDPIFASSLIYVCEHSENGAMGIIVNKPSGMALWQLLDQISIPLPNNNIGALPVHFGGPIQPDRGFVLHSPIGSWQSSLVVTDDLAVTTSKDILNSLAAGGAPEHMLAALGYSAWQAGQLEEEIVNNAWLTMPVSTHILFDLAPIERYHAAMALLGINPLWLSSDSGHA